jgi:hypothetical protein
VLVPGQPRPRSLSLRPERTEQTCLQVPSRAWYLTHRSGPMDRT